MATVFTPRSISNSAQVESSSPTHPEEVRRRLLLNLSGEMSDRIDDLSGRTGYETGELLDIAVSLLKLSLEAVEQGKQVGVAAEGQELELEFTGFHKNDPVA